jgi:hypothetical protein
VFLRTSPSLHLVPEYRYYVAYLKTDPAKEPLAIGQSMPRIIADAATKIGRHRNVVPSIDFTHVTATIILHLLALTVS